MILAEVFQELFLNLFENNQNKIFKRNIIVPKVLLQTFVPRAPFLQE